jgi:hypothetical protein
MLVHSSAGGGLRTPLSRQGQLRSGWPFRTFSVCSGRRRGGQGNLACSALDHPNIVFCTEYVLSLVATCASLEVWIE